MDAPNERSALEARTALFLHIEAHWPDAAESEHSSGRDRVFSTADDIVQLGDGDSHQQLNRWANQAHENGGDGLKDICGAAAEPLAAVSSDAGKSLR